MDDPPAAAARKPCCVCAASGGKHCTKCKSRHYCSKACQLVDWSEHGHKAQYKQLAKDFQDRLLYELMPAKKVKEEPDIVEDVAPAAGFKAAARLSAVRATAVVKASALNYDTPSWRGTCAICLDLLPVEGDQQVFYDCCCKKICKDCSAKCRQHDEQCPLCRAPALVSNAEVLRRLQKHVDNGNAEAQLVLGDFYRGGMSGLKKIPKRAVEMYKAAAAQEHALAQNKFGACHVVGIGVKIDLKTAVLWFRRAADQGFPDAQYNLGAALQSGRGVAQSHDEAVRWFRLAAAQGDADALYNLGRCYAIGQGVPPDLDEALRCFKRGAAKGHPDAAAAVSKMAVRS